MRQLADYVAAAVARNRFRGQKHLSLQLGLDATMVHHYLARGIWPGEAVMVRLAELAGVDPDVALLELAAWRTKDAEARRRFERLARMVAKTAASIALPLYFIAGAAGAAPLVNNQTIAAVLCILCEVLVLSVHRKVSGFYRI